MTPIPTAHHNLSSIVQLHHAIQQNPDRLGATWRLKIARRILERLTPEERSLSPQQFREQATHIVNRIFPALRYVTRASYRGAFLGLLDQPGMSQPSQAARPDPEQTARTPQTAAELLAPLLAWVQKHQGNGRATATTALCARLAAEDLPPGSLGRDLTAEVIDHLSDLDRLDEILMRGDKLAVGTRFNYTYAARKALQEARDGFLAHQHLERKRAEREAERAQELRRALAEQAEREAAEQAECEAAEQAECEAASRAAKDTASWREFPLGRQDASGQKAGILLKIPEGGIRVSEVLTFCMALMQIAPDYDPTAAQMLGPMPQT